MTRASLYGIEKIRQLRENRGLAVTDPQWLLEASQLINSKVPWRLEGPYADGCGRAVWINFLNGNNVNPRSFEVFCGVLGIEDWEEVADLPEGLEIRLKIGLVEDAARPIAEFLRDYGETINSFLPVRYPRLSFDITLVPSGDAREVFRQPNAYDIIMLDDPWVPYYWSNDYLHPLDEGSSLNDCLANRPFTIDDLFGRLFFDSFRYICLCDGRITALPIFGNVQLLIHRYDMQEKNYSQTGHDPLPRDEPHLDLESLKSFCSAYQKAGLNPLGIRDNSGNDIVAVFWELLRALGYKDRVDNGVVFIDLNIAKTALSLLKDKNFAKQIGLEKLRRSLLSDTSDFSIALGWPDWISADPDRDLSPINKIKFQRLATNPVMGIWVLALPKIPKSLRFRKHAIKVILALTADSTIQYLLAKAGNIPALENLNKDDPLRKTPFWQAHLFDIRSILSSSSPRPRTPYWLDIERQLNNQIYHGVFRDIPGKLVFCEPS
jgi:multiple sugar transport system substrate-binding protein